MNYTGEYLIDLNGRRIPVPVVIPGPVRYEGFTLENLGPNPSPAMLSLLLHTTRGGTDPLTPDRLMIDLYRMVCDRYRPDTIRRHENRIVAALYVRVEALREIARSLKREATP